MNVNIDGLVSAMTTGEGNGSDNMTGFRPVSGVQWQDATLMKLYRFTGLAKEVIRYPIKSCVRAGFSVKSADTEKAKLVSSMMKNAGFAKHAKKLMTWNALFGGSAMVLGVSGTGKFEDPLDVSRAKSLEFMRIYRREEIIKTRYVSGNPEDKRFGMPEYYVFIPSNGSEFKVHWTRVIELSGEEVDDETRIMNEGWGDSKFYSMFDQITRAESSYSSMARTLKDHSSFAITIAGLFDAIAEGREDEIRQRLSLFQRTRDSMNVLIHDKEETIDKITTNLSGLKDMAESQIKGLSLVSGIPVRILSGEQSGGLNNSGEGITGDWKEELEDLQEEVYEPIVRKVAEICASIVKLTDYSIEMGEIGRPTAKEVAEVYSAMATGDEINIRNKILHPAEVRASRFSGDQYSMSVTLDPDHDDIVFEETVQEAGK